MTIARLAIALLAIGLPGPAVAQVSTTAPAALLIFPLVSVDPGSGTDTSLEITNTDAAAVSARCEYENPSGPGGIAFTPFIIRLGTNQPVGWFAGRGLENAPNGGGSIPAVATLTGVLRCVAADASGKPIERNALLGTATIEQASLSPPYVTDSPRYNATGLVAIAGASNGDDHLVLGGPAAEYAACPGSLILPSFLDGAVLDLGVGGATQRTVSTTIALVTCAQRSTGSTTVPVGLSLTNEFGVTYTSAALLPEQLVTPLSKLDTTEPPLSIFSAANEGAPSATIHITPLGSNGILGVAFSAYADPTSDLTRHSAAAIPRLDGAVAGPDVIDLVALPTAPPTKSATPTGIVPTAGATATAATTATVRSTVAPSGTATLSCAGDCNGDGKVTINELIIGVNIVLGTQPLLACPSFDSHQTGQVTISDLVVAVNHVLLGC